jgi:hypothetical protein
MNLLQLLLFFLAVGFIGVVYLNLNHMNQIKKRKSTPLNSNINALTQLIHVQNETIHALEQHLKAKHKDLALVSEEYTKLIEVSELIGKLSIPSIKSDEKLEVPPPKSGIKVGVRPNGLLTSAEKECEFKYGMDLVDSWRKNREVWCSGDHIDNHDRASELVCYPYHQDHKKLDGRGPDLFCEATNFLVDFSKVLILSCQLDESSQCYSLQVKGDHDIDHKPAMGSQYLSFERGSISGECKTTSSFKSGLFMPHHSLQVG